jgi:hypothetical protein
MARLRVSYSDRRNGAPAAVAVELDLDAVTVADPQRLAQLIREQQTYVRIAVLDEPKWGDFVEERGEDGPRRPSLP